MVRGGRVARSIETRDHEAAQILEIDQETVVLRRQLSIAKKKNESRRAAVLAAFKEGSKHARALHARADNDVSRAETTLAAAKAARKAAEADRVAIVKEYAAFKFGRPRKSKWCSHCEHWTMNGDTVECDTCQAKIKRSKDAVCCDKCQLWTRSPTTIDDLTYCMPCCALHHK